MRHTSTISVELTGPDGWSELIADASFNVSRGWYGDRDEQRIEDLTVTQLYRVERKRVIGSNPVRYEETKVAVSCPDWLEELICDMANPFAILDEVAEDAYGDACDEAYERARDRRMEAE